MNAFDKKHKAMRDITHIVLHCTATPQTTTIESIMNYWYAPKPKGNGWKTPGYHYIIKPDGSAVNLVPIDKPSNGVAGHNSHSVHISFIGGIDKKGGQLDNRTPAQIAKQIELIKEIKLLFPMAEILGHRDFPNVKKFCPSFDAIFWVKFLGF